MSTARAALVTDAGIVESVIVVDLDGTYTPPEGLTAHVLPEGSQVGPGWTLAGGVYSPPPAEDAGPTLPTVLDLQDQLDVVMDILLDL